MQPRAGTCFIRRQMKSTPPDFIPRWEAWTGFVLGNSTNDAGWPVVLTLRDDTGELIEMGRDVWHSLIAQHWAGDIVKILWEPHV